MSEYYSRHFVTTERDQRLPLHLTSVGYSDHQTAIIRDEGFPSFHWLHTVEGAGEFTVNGVTVRLSANQGILLKPKVPHAYFAESARWSTWYMTFDGALAGAITASLELQHMLPISWDHQAPIASIHELYGNKVGYSFDFAGIAGSQEVYSLLSSLKQFGQAGGELSLSKGHERLTPIYMLIEEHYGDPGLGLDKMAETLRISSQHLTTLFRKSWGVSPYRYLLQFRIEKSKELLLSDADKPVKEIGGAVGFLDYSHFVSTFRKYAGMTPMQFRRQFGHGLS